MTSETGKAYFLGRGVGLFWPITEATLNFLWTIQTPTHTFVHLSIHPFFLPAIDLSFIHPMCLLLCVYEILYSELQCLMKLPVSLSEKTASQKQLQHKGG